jgi:N-acetyl-anhydromuramyl-L-alanine amidase AmpD
MNMRESTDEIIIHCAATKPSMDTDAATIDRWHRERGWLKIGYHYVIKRDGTVETGRERDEVGAHAKGHNSKSVGVCLVGGLSEDNEPETNFTDEQWASLGTLVDELTAAYPDAKVIGHNDVSEKSCPTFDVGEWYEGYSN